MKDRDSPSVKYLPRFIGSAAAGTIEMCTFYPFDTMGKRLMYDRTKRPAEFAQKIQQVRNAVFLSPTGEFRLLSLYDGFCFAALYKVAQRTWQFGTQPIFRDLLTQNKTSKQFFDSTFGPRWGEAFLSATAGALMGFGECVFVPLNALKIKAQTNPGSINFFQLGPSFWTAHWWDLWRGGLWTLYRNVPGSFFLFGGSELSKQYVFTQHESSLVHQYGSSLCGATCSILVASPFDVVKTRLQAQEWNKTEKGVQVIRTLMQKEGTAALFKGITPKMLTIGPKLAYGFGLAEWLTRKLLHRQREEEKSVTEKRALKSSVGV